MKHMYNMRIIAVLLVLVGSSAVLSACGDIGEREDLKSPCVGLEGSPCGPKRSVNDWWLT
jgi:hypothetical protein